MYFLLIKTQQNYKKKKEKKKNQTHDVVSGKKHGAKIQLSLWKRRCNLVSLLSLSSDCQEPQTESITCLSVMSTGEGLNAVPWTAPLRAQASIHGHLWHTQLWS